MSTKHKVEGSVGVQLSLIITPMLDMSFQILAFFIMTYHPAALEGHIPGSLTPPENPATKSKDPALPSDPALSTPEEMLKPELDDVITVQVKAVVADPVDPDNKKQDKTVGKPRQILIRGTIATAPEVLEGSDTMEWDKVLVKLEARLKQMAGKGSKGDLKLAGDGGLRYQYVLEVYDACKRAGYDKIHFVPPQIKAKIKQ